MNLKESLYRTIAFFDLFDYPLTAHEIQRYLYGMDRPVHVKEIEGVLKTVPGIVQLKDYYVINGREGIVESRKQRKFISEKLWARTRLYGGYLKHTPFIRMVAVCNNLSYDNASEQSDIDLFIVVKPGRMWTARFWITVLLHFFGVRRHGSKIAGRFCLSFFVDETALNVGPLQIEDKDPYLAYWTKTLSPIFGQNTYHEFKKQNADWLKKYHLQFDEGSSKNFFVTDKSRKRAFFEKLLKGKLGNGFEKFLQRTFKKRTLRRFKHLGPEANVIVRDSILKFHNHDKRAEYLDAWESAVKKLMNLPDPAEDSAED